LRTSLRGPFHFISNKQTVIYRLRRRVLLASHFESNTRLYRTHNKIRLHAWIPLREPHIATPATRPKTVSFAPSLSSDAPRFFFRHPNYFPRHMIGAKLFAAPTRMRLFDPFENRAAGRHAPISKPLE
jgi:hypothetical protein